MDAEISPREQNRELDRAAARLLEAVPRLRRLISAAVQTDDSSATLTFTQFRILGRLLRAQQLPSELARTLEVTPATASETVDLLVRRGLVERRDQPGDRRRTLLTVTPAGQDCWKAARARSMDALIQLLAGMDSTRITSLEEGLEALLELLGDGGSPLSGGRGEDAG